MGKTKILGFFVGITFSMAAGQILLPNWHSFPGSCSEIGVVGRADDQAVPMCVSTASSPYGGISLDRWSGSYSTGYWYGWASGYISKVAMDSANNPWVVMYDGTIYQWYPYWGWYQRTINGYGAREIAMAGSGSPSVWAISNALFGSSTTDYWIARMDPSGAWTWIYGAAREIAVDMADGLPNSVPPRAWVVASNGNVYEWIESMNNNSGGWLHHPYVKSSGSTLDVPGLGAIDIAAGHGRLVYIVGNDLDQNGNGSVWVLRNGTPTRKWEYMHTRGRKIALSHSDNIFVIKADNSVTHLYTP